jgi:NAD(P)H-nitrite reductase large subunit
MLDAGSAAVILSWLHGHGVDIRLSTDVKEFRGAEGLREVILSDGSRIPTRLAVVGKGVRANVSLVAGSPIHVESGIRVDDRLETDAPDVYAAGDVAEAYDSLRRQPWINALWPIAVEQGRLAAANMSGGTERYAGSVRMNALAVFGYPCVSVGHVYDLPDADTLVYHGQRPANTWPGNIAQGFIPAWPGTCRKLFFQDGRLVGAVLMGDVSGAGIVTEAIRAGRPVSRAWAEATLAHGPLFSRQMVAVWEAA